MTWEETIQMIRTKSEYSDLVDRAYFHEDLVLNVERFGKSEEYAETLNIIKEFVPEGIKVLDIGSGNGISAVNFALKGYNVTSLEPDPSNTVGCGAIQQLKKHYGLDNLTVHSAYAEDMNFNEASIRYCLCAAMYASCQ